VIAPYRQAAISGNLSEPLQAVYVQEGDHVQAGQVLARQLVDDLQAQLASAERLVQQDVARYNQLTYQVGAVNQQDLAAIKSAQATLRQDEVNLSGAQTDLNRYEQLLGQGYIPPQTVQQQRVTVAGDQQAQLAQAIANARSNGGGFNQGQLQQELAQAQQAANSAQASVVELQRQIARATIIAPAEGIVDSVNANPGEYPSARQLFTVEEIDQVYAILPASSDQILSIRNGAHATVTPIAGATGNAGGPPMAGSVVAVLDQIQPGTTNFTVKVLVPNPNLRLRAGMSVTATIEEPPINGVVIPVTAFVDDTHTSVFTINKGVVQQQHVREVDDQNGNAVVTGLPPGTHIVKDVTAANVQAGDEIRSS
jgi:multidrug efflux pump subunit AcrA (membrane-fusion protein)